MKIKQNVDHHKAKRQGQCQQVERQGQGQQGQLQNKVNDVYSIHSHYKRNTEEVPRPKAAAFLLWFPFIVAMNRVDVVDLVVDLVDLDLDVDLVDVDLDDQKYDFCLSWTDLNIVDGLNRNTSRAQRAAFFLLKKIYLKLLGVAIARSFADHLQRCWGEEG